MKRTALTVFLCAGSLVLCITPASAQQATTKELFPACLTEEWLDDMNSFAAVRDKASFEAYISSQKCILLKGGLKVTVVNRGLLVNQIAYKGIKLWVSSDGLDQ